MMTQKELYSQIEYLIIVWNNDGNKTAGSLTREIMELLDNKDNTEWCHYSDLPSPMSYAKCADYDSMGNHGRFPKVEKKQPKTNKFKKLFEKLIKSEKHKPTFSK